MTTTTIAILLIICIAALFVAAIILGLPIAGGARKSQSRFKNNLGSIVSAQRESAAYQRSPGERERPNQVFDTSQFRKTTGSKLTLQKKLKFAQWKISPAAFHLMELGVSFAAFMAIGIRLNYFMMFLCLAAGPVFMRWILNFRIDRRFKAFDLDYSPFLLSLVGLLKTGMNVMGALEAAASGLEEGSLVREEVELMMERLRFGVSEDKSIGAFGEDIAHPEIELFVQALLLSRRVGGTLSDTLDRLAKQVRRRQYFRKSAMAAIGMQRGSIWFIVAILFAMEVYLYFVYPEAVSGAWNNPTGWQVWQVGIGLIICGIFWVRQVTKIKV